MRSKVSIPEIFFQIALNAVVFLFYAYDRRGDSFMPYHFSFFLNYAFAAFIINYIALPYFYKNRKIVTFAMIAFVAIAFSILLEELILEKIYFPERGDSLKAWWAFLEIVPLVTIISGGKFAWDAITKQKEVEQLKSLVRQSELQFLKSQINPHFLFNNLNNLYSYALESSPKTPDIILQLSALLRYMLYECNDDYVMLNKEIDQLENFVNLSELQIEERGSVSIMKEGNFANFKIAPLILIVFVENAFKHSVSSQSENIVINVRIQLADNGNLSFSCENSFHDTSNNQNLANGIGLANVKKRLELLYPDKHSLRINKNDGMYKLTLEVALK